jgi:hypothetical protein
MDKQLKVPSVPSRVRTRIWGALQRFNDGFQTVDDTGWQEWTDTMAVTYTFLAREYGTPSLTAYVGDDNSRGVVGLDHFVQRCYPAQLLDVVEGHYLQLDAGERRELFQQEVNRILREEAQPWRMSAGELFMLDSQFLDTEVLARTEELLSANNYAGALDEFRDARNELTAGETREAIAKAQAAFESTMKTILGAHDGNASSLIRDLVAKGFFDDLPPNTQASAFGEAVLLALAFMGNRLGRHGQGQEVVEVPRHYGELAVHLAGSFIRLLVERQLELQAPPPTPVPDPGVNLFVPAAVDDIPF